MTDLFAFAVGVARHAASGTMLDCYFPTPLINPGAELSEHITRHFKPGVAEIDASSLNTFAQALDAGELKQTWPLSRARIPRPAY